MSVALGNRRKFLFLLALIGIVLAIVGAAIIGIPGMPMRGSGIGTVSLVGGVLLLVVCFAGMFRRSQLPPPPPN